VAKALVVEQSQFEVFSADPQRLHQFQMAYCNYPFSWNLMLTAQASLTPQPHLFFHALLDFGFLVVMVEVILWITTSWELYLWTNSFPIYHSTTLIMEMLCRKVCWPPSSYPIAPLHYNISNKIKVLQVTYFDIVKHNSLLKLKGITWMFWDVWEFSFNSFMQSTTTRNKMVIRCYQHIHFLCSYFFFEKNKLFD
jgi:hypothetical protein